MAIELSRLVCTLNRIWDQYSIKLRLIEKIKLDEHIIESKLIDLVLYIYNSGFDLFRLLCELIFTITSNDDEISQQFVSICCSKYEFVIMLKDHKNIFSCVIK